MRWLLAAVALGQAALGSAITVALWERDYSDNTAATDRVWFTKNQDGSARPAGGGQTAWTTGGYQTWETVYETQSAPTGLQAIPWTDPARAGLYLGPRRGRRRRGRAEGTHLRAVLVGEVGVLRGWHLVRRLRIRRAIL
ncbi:MAG: hypothetical protein KIS66_14950 [Fimbriimonadaceae bacterium]|nr:hypothetical protein [Fimbriimonadaceae bacterium]